VVSFVPSPAITFVSGNMTIGRASSFKGAEGVYYLNNAEIEPSAVFCFTPPGVVKLVHETTTLTGLVTTSVSSNMLQTITLPNTILFSVTNTNSIISNNEFSGDTNSCSTPIITKINTVSPDSSGNIDIYGIDPLSIAISTGQFELVTALGITDVCPEKNKISPPTNNSDSYHTDILSATSPEWKTWPRFS
jgi:hypothetical protein